MRKPSIGPIKGHEEESLRVGKNRAVEKGRKGAVKLASRAEKGKKKEVRFCFDHLKNKRGLKRKKLRVVLVLGSLVPRVRKRKRRVWCLLKRRKEGKLPLRLLENLLCGV